MDLIKGKKIRVKQKLGKGDKAIDRHKNLTVVNKIIRFSQQQMGIKRKEYRYFAVQLNGPPMIRCREKTSLPAVPS